MQKKQNSSKVLDMSEILTTHSGSSKLKTDSHRFKFRIGEFSDENTVQYRGKINSFGKTIDSSLSGCRGQW